MPILAGALDDAKVRAAWELARRVQCGSRAAVWALEAGDARTAAAAPPPDLAAWARERVGLEPDPRAVPLRLGRAQPFWCSMFVARAPGEPAALADAATFAADLFPIGDGWKPMQRAAVIESMAYVIGRDLAYRAERMPAVKALGKARGFAGRYGAGAIFLASFTVDGDCVASWPITLHTFSRAFAIVDGARVGVLAFGGED